MDTPEPIETVETPQWQPPSDPMALRQAVRDLEPTIQQTLSNIGIQNDPYLHSQARVLTAKAVQTYDPSRGATLPTWVNRQLMPLRRMKRESQQSITMPESIQLDAYKLMSSERELEDRLGREPTLEELSEEAGVAIPRIKKVRRRNIQTPADQQFVGGAGGTEEGVSSPGYSEPDWVGEAADYVYTESDYVDKKILEHKMGYAGAEEMDGQTLAVKLGVSPSQISRRAAKLAYKMNHYARILEGGR